MSSFADQGFKSITLISGVTSPGSSTTGVVLGNAFVGLGQEATAVIDAQLLGATGGTLDIVIQSSVDADQAGNGTWYDVVHFPQLAAAAAATRYVATVSRGFNKTTTTPTQVNPTSLPPTLPVNTVIPDGLGIALRVVAIAGVGTTLGAAQTVKVGASK